MTLLTIFSIAGRGREGKMYSRINDMLSESSGTQPVTDDVPRFQMIMSEFHHYEHDPEVSCL